MQNLNAILEITNISHVDLTMNTQNEMKWYLDENETLSVRLEILECWWFLESQYSTMTWITKNILAISLAEIKVEQMFNLKWNICNYWQDHLHEETIKKIMIVKHAHQTNMIDKIFLSEMKLRKKIMNDDKNSSEIKKNDYFINEE